MKSHNGEQLFLCQGNQFGFKILRVPTVQISSLPVRCERWIHESLFDLWYGLIECLLDQRNQIINEFLSIELKGVAESIGNLLAFLLRDKGDNLAQLTATIGNEVILTGYRFITVPADETFVPSGSLGSSTNPLCFHSFFCFTKTGV